MEPLVESRLPTKYGGFIILAFKANVEEMPHLALISDKFVKGSENIVPVRVHSECMTGDVFASSRCDCGEQLSSSMMHLQKEGGILIYLRQEGRGIGLVEKLKAYNLQDVGQDTYEANVNLGHPEDGRSFVPAIEILRHLKVKSINPDKVSAFDEVDDINVIDRLPLEVDFDSENNDYLEAKRLLKGHLFGAKS